MCCTTGLGEQGTRADVPLLTLAIIYLIWAGWAGCAGQLRNSYLRPGCKFWILFITFAGISGNPWLREKPWSDTLPLDNADDFQSEGIWWSRHQIDPDSASLASCCRCQWILPSIWQLGSPGRSGPLPTASHLAGMPLQDKRERRTYSLKGPHHMYQCSLTLNKAMNYWRQPPPADGGSERTAACIVPESADTPASEVPPSSRIIPLDTGAQF